MMHYKLIKSFALSSASLWEFDMKYTWFMSVLLEECERGNIQYTYNWMLTMGEFFSPCKMSEF